MRRKLNYVELKCQRLLQLGIYIDLYSQFSLLFYEILMVETALQIIKCFRINTVCG